MILKFLAIFSAVFSMMVFTAETLKSEDTFSVLGNGGRGTAKGYDKEALLWYQTNLPTLPRDYIKQNSFIHFQPLMHYADHVNWSLFPLKHFKHITKDRWIHIPPGSKIKRDKQTGVWTWPIGAETAKQLGGSVINKEGIEVLVPFELRLARKIGEGKKGKSIWAMATYVKDPKTGDWIVSTPPYLELKINKAKLKSGKIRTFSYSLTSPEGCMTCHSRGSYSNVDLKRGDEFVYAANDELITGKVRMRLSEYMASPEIQHGVVEQGRSEKEDWVDLLYKDTAILEQNRKSLEYFLE